MGVLRPLFGSPEVDLHIVSSTPFLYIKGSRTLIMADLHLGFEEAASRGLSYSARKTPAAYSAVFLPRIQLKRALGLFDVAVDNVEVERVVINGDLKHAFDRLLKQEREEVVELIKHFRERGVGEVVVVRGNHDNFIKPVLRRLDVMFVSGFSTSIGAKKALFVHGHEDISLEEYDVVVIGHEHPSLKCFEVYRFPCFLKIPVEPGKVLVVMPATGPYHPGIVVTPNPQDYLSPLIRKLSDLGSMSIVTWIDLGEAPRSGIDYFEAVGATNLVKVERYAISNREVAIVEFRDYETAHVLCML